MQFMGSKFLEFAAGSKEKGSLVLNPKEASLLTGKRASDSMAPLRK
jgi:hypothetical protein